MATREWIELREINGTSYLIKYSEVDTHEGYVSRSSYILRVASAEDIEKYEKTE
jgi:hypothetical protein